MYKLEDRILFDGAAIADVVDAQQEAEAQQEAAQAAEAEEAAQQDTTNHNADDSSDGDGSSTEAHDNDTLAEVLSEIHTGNLGSDGQRVDVLLVSSSLENADDIVNSASTDTIIVVYDARTASAADLLQQITTALDGKVADSIGFVTESGENAHIQLFADTDTSLDTVNDSVHQDFFSHLDSLLDEGGQVNLFASNLASTAEGEALVDAMSDAIGHDVAASTDETGSESAGGDWDLEYSTNENIVDVAETYLDENLVDNFSSLLEDHVNHEVAFINSSVMNVDEILNDLGDNVEIVMLEEGTDGLQQITDYLNENSDVKYDAVHILTHGNEGYFVLNGEVVDGTYVNDNAADFVQWRNALSEDADVMIYGCNLAGNQDGQSLVANIASLTGADVAASVDTVGDTDWSLDYNVGDINYGAFDIHGYNYHLSDQLVTNNADSGAGSLRQAITDVLTGESVTFDNSYTITLSSGSIQIAGKSISIAGGLNTIVVTSSSSDIFDITATGSLTMSDITISATGFGYNAVTNAGTLNIDGTSTITGDIDNEGTLELLAGATLNINDDLSGAGTYTFNNTDSTVDYSGANQTIGNYDYYNLTMSGGGSKTVGSGVQIANDLTISNNTSVDVINGLTVGNDLSLQSGELNVLTGNLTVNNDMSIVNGDLTTSGGNLAVGGILDFSGTGTASLEGGAYSTTTGEVRYSYNGAQTVNDWTFNDLTLSGGGTKTASSSIGVGNDLNINDGITFDVGGDLTVTGATTFEAASAGELQLTGSLSTGSFDSGIGTVTYDGVAQTITTGINYYNLTMSGSGTKTASGALQVNNDLTLSGSAALSADNNVTVINNMTSSTSGDSAITGILSVANILDIAGAGALAATSYSTTTGEVRYSYNGAQEVNDWTFNDLTLSGGGTKTASSSIDVGNDLNINDGITFDVGGDLTVTGATTFEAASAGELQLTGSFSTGSFDSWNSTVTYDGADQTITTGINYYNLTISGSGAKTASGALQVNNDLTLSGSAALSADNNVTVINNMTSSTSGDSAITGILSVANILDIAGAGALAATSYSTTTGEVRYSYNGAQEVNDWTFNDLTLSGGGTKTASSSIDVGNDLNINDGITFDVGGDLTVTGATTFEAASAGELQLTGSFSTGSFDSWNSTVTYDGADQTITTGINYYNLTMSGSGTKTASGALQVNNDLILSGSAALSADNNVSVTNDMTSSTSGDTAITGTLAVGGILDIAGAGAFTATSYSTTTGEVRYSYNGDQTINNWTYYDLTLSGGGTKTASNDLTVTNNMTVGACDVSIAGDLSVTNLLDITDIGVISLTGNFTPGTGEVRYSYNGDQTINDWIFYDLTLSGGGTKTASNDLTVTNNMTVGASNVDITGDLSVTNLLNITDIGVISLTGNFTPGTGEVRYSYNGNQTINDWTFYDLTLSGGGTKTANNSLAVTHNMTVGASNVSITGDLSVTNLLNITDIGVISLTGNFTPGTGEVRYSYNGNQTINDWTFYDLSLSGSGTKTGANISASNDIIFYANANLAVTGTLSITNNLIHNNMGTVIYCGDATQEILGTDYYNLSIANGNKTLAGTTSVVNDFRFINGSSTYADAGLLVIGSKDLVLASTASIFGDSGFSGRYFNTSGTGTIISTFAALQNRLLTVGSDTEWSTIILSNWDFANQTISLQTTDGVTSPSAPLNRIVDMTFTITAKTGSNFNLFIWTSSAMGSDFDFNYTDINFSSDSGDTWTKLGDQNTATLTSVGDYFFESIDPLVVTNNNDSGNGSLRSAIDYANNHSGIDTITFDSSVFNSNNPLTITLNGTGYSITDSLIIEGAGFNSLIIDAQGLSSIFSIDNSSADIYVSIDGMKLTGGGNVTSGNGGAIYNNELLELNNVVISSSSANNGGAIYNDYRGNLLINQSLIIGNSATASGGAIYNNGGKIQAENLWVHGNSAENGAGIYNAVYTIASGDDAGTYIGEIILQNTTLDNNFANSNGGAIYNQGKIYGENLTLAANIANEGSAIYVDGQDDSGTTATTLFNSTIALNNSGSGNYAIFRADSTKDTFYLNSSLMAGNSSNSNYNINDSANNYIGISNYITGSAGSAGTTASDGIFADATPIDHGGWVGTLKLNTANAIVQNNIIDHGLNDGPTIYDARGYMRNSTRDIGAYEANAYVARNADRNIYYTSVQAAIAGAGNGEEIELFQTRYYRTSALTIGKDLILSGEGKDATVLDAQYLYGSEFGLGSGANRLLTVDDTNPNNTIFVRIDGMTFRNGGSVAQGGAIYSSENLLLNNTSIYGSAATSEGGAIYNNGGYLYIERSEIYNNSVTTSSGDAKGGAISNISGKVRITESSIYGNSVNANDNGYGGAIYTEDSGSGTAALTIISSAIYDNTATGNTSSSGGGIYGTGSNQVEITNSTFAHNTAANAGGMYFAGGGTYKLTNITVAYNDTTTTGQYAVEFDGGNLYSINSLFLGNYSNGTQSKLDLNFTVDTTSSIFNSVRNTNSSGYFDDTRITDHGGWSKTIALAAGSAAINGGTNSGVPNHDQRGYDTNGTRDIGAYEYNGIVAYYWDANASTPSWVGTSTISIAGTTRMGEDDTFEHVIKLVNTRILEANITINTWRNASSSTLASRTVSIYGHQEGGTVIDAGLQGQIFNIIGSRYTSGTTTTYVMGTTNINRLTITNGFTTGNGGAITTTQASDGGVINVNYSSMTYNIALGEGGAVHSHGADSSWGNKKDATYNINSSLVAYNIAAGSGGAISIVNKVNVTSSTVAYNRSFGSGGAIMVNANGGGSISNSTVSRNFANTNGGGLYLANGYSVGNTILAKNRTAGVISSASGSSYDPDYESGYDYYWEAGTLSNGGHNLVEYQNGHWIKSTATNFFGPKSDKSPYGISNGDILGAKEYLFSNEAVSDNGGWTYTMALAQNSAAVDKGSGTTADQRGYDVSSPGEKVTRDIGAYELNGIVATIGTESYSTIEEAVASASAGDTITLVGSRILGHDLVIGNNVTIKTASSSSYYSLALIDAKSYGRIFAVESSTVTLNLGNLILANGTILIGSGQGGQQAAGNGGAIFSAGTLTLSEVSIANSFAQLSGGAIYSAKSLTINTSGINQTGSSVTPNRGAYFARNSAQSNGGAIYASNSLSITGVSSSGDEWSTGNMVHFDYNFANAGGAIYANYVVNANYTLDGVQFVGNNALTRGGAIYMLSNSDTTFNALSVTNNSAMRYGGTIYTETTNALTLRDVDIFNSFSFSDGGALYYDGLNNSNATLTYYNSSRFAPSTFWINHNASLEGSGGAFYVKDANLLHIYSEKLNAGVGISDNQALKDGGAIYVTNTGTGASSYGIILGDTPGVDVVDNNISIFDNIAGENGGAIYMADSGNFYACQNVTICNNIAGANPFWASGYGLNNPAVWTGEGKGGAIYVVNSGDFTFRESSEVYGNTARNQGGAFYIKDSGLINIDFVEFGNNASGRYYYLDTSTYTRSWVDVNTTAGQGGALYLEGNGNILLNDTDFYDSYSTADGGAIYVKNGTNEDRTVTINNSSFDRNRIYNSSASYGGALYIDNAKAFNIANSTFAFNSNTAIYLGYGSMSLNFTTFAYNNTGADTGVLGINIAGATGKTSAFVVNNSILHDGTGVAGTPYSFGDTVTITADKSTNNIYTNFNLFVGAQKANLSGGSLNSITAYLPYGDQVNYASQTALIRDSHGNLVGDSTGTTSAFITNNLYLSAGTDYAGRRHSRTLALESINSIANRYESNGNETFAGDITKTVSYNRSGALVDGLVLIDNITAVYGWLSHTGGIAEYEASADGKPLSVYSAGVELTEVDSSNIDSLKVGQWTWDSTNNKIVVRLADDASPSSTVMTTRNDTNDAIIYDQRGNMRSGVTVSNSAVIEETSWSQYGDAEDNEYQIGSDYKVTGITINFESGAMTLTEGTSIDSLVDGQWIWDADNNIVIMKIPASETSAMENVQLTTEQVAYTYYTYGEFDVDGDPSTALQDSWIKVVVAESGTTRTAVNASDVHAGLGAFKANFYMTVTTNADNSKSPYYYYGIPEFTTIDNALDDGVTLRESVFWIDSYDMTDLTVSGLNGNVKFDADRYVKFADSMFDGTHNVIDLDAGHITISSNVVIGMVNDYNGYSYTEFDGTSHSFAQDNTFLAQNDTNRITLVGNGSRRLIDNSYRGDHSTQSGDWNSYRTAGLNNLTLRDGHIDAARKVTNSHEGYGGAIYNGAGTTMYINNSVIKDSTVTNTGESSTDSYMARGGGIYNSGTMTIQDSTIIGNEALGTDSDSSDSGQGGGIYNGGTLTIKRSLIADNSVSGIINKDSTEGNNSGTGGGIYSNGSLYLYSSTVSGNYINENTSEVVDGAAITVTGGRAYLYGNTISYNKAYDGTDNAIGPKRPGYAVYLENSWDYSFAGLPSVAIRNNIFAQNYVDGGSSQIRRDIIVTDNVANHGFDDFNNIVGSYYQASDYYDFAANIATSGDIHHFNSSGIITDLNMSDELLYNGGMTKNYRIETASVAIGEGDYTNLSIPFTSINITYDQRNATAGTDFTTRSTIGAYELITQISISSDVADAALPADGIAYDFSNDRGGWLVNLRNALYLADQNATVTVTVVSGAETFELVGGELLVFNGITLTTADDEILTIDAKDNSRIFAITDPVSARVVDVTLENLKLVNGNVASDDRGGLGGAIYTTEGLTLSNVEISDVTAASHGGAIYSLAGGLTLTDVTIDNATSTKGDGGAINQQTDAFIATHLTISNSTAGGSGGAIYITDGSTFALDSNVNGISTINDNTSGAYGGGIYFRGGSMNITDAYIYNNAAASDKDGGGLFVNSSGTITITTSTFGNSTDSTVVNNNGNTAARGAGIFVYSGNLEMVNSTISGNTATKDGGGLYFDGTSLSLTYVTIANNYAGEGYLGGGVYMNNGSLTMINSVIAQNYETTTDLASDFYLGGSASVSSATYSAIGQSNYGFYAHSDTNIVGNASGIIENLGLDTSLYDNGGNTPTLYVMANSELVGKAKDISSDPDYNISTSQNDSTPGSRGTTPTIGAYEGRTTIYYYDGDGDVNSESNWYTGIGGTGTQFTGQFKTAINNQYVFAEGYNGELKVTQKWTITDRSFVTVATAATFTIGGTSQVKAIGYRSGTDTNMTISVEGSTASPAKSGGTLVFANAETQLVNLSLASTSNVEYSYNGNQTVYTADYGNLTISGGGDKTATTAITVAGDLSVNDSIFELGGNLAVANDVTLTSGIITGGAYDIDVTGDLTGTGTVSGTNITLGSASSYTGDITGSGSVTINGETDITGNIEAADVTIDGNGSNVSVVGGITSTNGDIAVYGTGSTITLGSVTTEGNGDIYLGSSDVDGTTDKASTVILENSTVSSEGGTIYLNSTDVDLRGATLGSASNSDLVINSTLSSTAGTNTIYYGSTDPFTKAVTITDSTLNFNIGSNDATISGTSPTALFNLTNFTVTNGTLGVITEGDITINNVDTSSLTNFDGTLYVECDDISFTGTNIFVDGTMNFDFNNSGYFKLSGDLEFQNNITVGNVMLTGGSTVDATLSSRTGNVTVGNVTTDTGVTTGNITLEAANTGASVTIGGTSGNINNVTLIADNNATVNGTIDITGDFSASASNVYINNDVTADGNVTVTGDLNLGADITASNGSVSVGGDIELTGSSSSISAIDLDLNNISGASDLALTATGSDPIILGNIDLSDGILTLVDGTFNSGSVDVGQLDVESQASLDTGSNNITAESGITNDGILTTTGTITVTSGNLTNTSTETLNAGDITVNGDLINSGTLTATGTVVVSGNLTNTSTNTFEADKAEVGGNVYDIGTMNIDTFTLTNHVPAGTHTASVRFSDGTVINEFIVEADKHITLVGGDITVNTFTFEADATPTSTFTLAAGTSVTVVGDINYNTTGYDANYFVTTGTQQLIRTMDGTNYLEYRIKNISSATVTVVALKADAGEKISVHIEDSVKLNGQVISGIQDTVCFTTYLDHINGTSAIDIGLRINWDSSIEGSNFTPGPDKSLETLEGGWSQLCTVDVDSAAGRSSIDCDITHNGTYTIAMAGADMSVPPNPMNVNIYEMANSHFLSFNDNLDTNIFLPFEIGVYPYFKPDTYATAESLDQLGEAIYRQMEYRFVTDPQTNPLHGQVSPIGAETGQAITEQASLTLTADAPVYVVADGEYSAGEGWLPITEPASVENIEEYQEPITQGQINEFYLEFGGREDIFTRPASFKSDLDAMLDDLLAG